MADVQLEHGYVKIANRLLEAIIEARFGDRQSQILLVLIRLTYGWRRTSVQLTEFALAEYVGAVHGDAKRAGGAFRGDLADLLKERVIIRVDSGGRRGLWTWGVNKNFSTWGRYAVAPARLAARWSAKPKWSPTDDAALSNEVAQTQATSTPDDSDESDLGEWPGPGPDDQPPEWPESGPDGDEPENESGPESGRLVARLPGHSVAPNQATSTPQLLIRSDIAALERQGKTMKDITTTATSISVVPEIAAAADAKSEENRNADDRQTDTAHAEPAPKEFPPTDHASEPHHAILTDEPSEKNRDKHEEKNGATPRTVSRAPDDAELEAIRQYAIAMSTAANAGITRRWGEQPTPVIFGSGLNLAEELIREGVPIELARATILSVCAASKNARPMGTLSYFREPVMEAFRAAEQRSYNAADPAMRARGGAPTSIATVVTDPGREKREHEEREQYNAAARMAAVTWWTNRENAADYQAIREQVAKKYAAMADSAWRTKAITAEVIKACADRAGFPEFDAWRQSRTGAGAA